MAKNERLCGVEAAAPGCALRSSLAASTRSGEGRAQVRILPPAGNQRLGSGFSKVARTALTAQRSPGLRGSADLSRRRGRSIIATVNQLAHSVGRRPTLRGHQKVRRISSLRGGRCILPNYTEVQVPLRLPTIECDGARALPLSPLGTVRHPAPAGQSSTGF